MKNVVNTTFPKLTDVNFSDNLEFIKKFTNYVEILGGFENEISINLNYYKALVSCDSVTTLVNFYKELNDKLTVLKNDFVNFWVIRFANTAEPLKKIIKEMADFNDDSFFTDLSDSIGMLLNSSNLLDDSTIPFFDYTANIYGSPNTIPVQLKNKISPVTMQISNTLSMQNSILMRNNLKKINLPTIDSIPSTDSLTPHGLNLITDLNTYLIVNENLKPPVFSLMQTYKNIYSYIVFLCNIANNSGYNIRDNTDKTGTNQQLVTNLVFSMNVEKIEQTVDLLQHKFKNILNYKTIENTISNNITQTNPSLKTVQLNQIEGLS